MADLHLKTLSKADYPRWDSFVASSPQGTIFNTSRWASLVCKAFPVEHSIYAVLEHDQIVGGISFFHKRRMGLRILTRIPLSPYTGVLFSPVQGAKAQKSSTEQHEITSLILEAIENKFHFAQFGLHPSVNDVRPFLWRGWHTLPQYTYVNSLADIGKTWELLSSSLRRKIHRAEEKSFKVVLKNDVSLLLTFQEMTYAKARLKPILPRSLFQRYCETIAEANLLRLYSAVDVEGNVHAERALIVDGNRAYDWMAGTNLQLGDEHANQLLVWEIFKRLSAEGIRTFDFLGANTASIAEFKRGFGGELTCYFEVRYFASTFVRMLNYFSQRWSKFKRLA
jgi:lipid II:glycine glycyltransferase (peptidoglycan interpeptide bridge formation enzyme)